MSEMIERVAMAILKRRFYDCEPEVYNNDVNEFAWKLDPDHIIDAHDEARAAIEAMREPSEEMKRAVAAQWGHRTWSQYGEAIDAALKETA